MRHVYTIGALIKAPLFIVVFINKDMKLWGFVLVGVVFLALAVGADCPANNRGADAYANVDITPQEKFFGDAILVNVTWIKDGVITPTGGEKVVFSYYGVKRSIEESILKTNERGLALFKPIYSGPHLVTVGGHDISIDIISICGDGSCGRNETDLNCPEDCAPCWDNICAPNEAPSCPDCVVCGDGICSLDEDRLTCVEDCGYCGDFFCDIGEFETGCRDCVDCGNGWCNAAESELSCPQDCAPMNTSSNGNEFNETIVQNIGSVETPPMSLVSLFTYFWTPLNYVFNYREQ
jgi:hypothetical protein